MSSPLDRIEAAAKDDRWTNLTYVSPTDVLALVNVAKAAEEEHSDCPLVLCDVCEALAALNKEPA